nr:FkbM family methyltransferase [Saprospiraceae bacterium]
RKVKSETFFGKKINLLLPSGTDIFLTGGKSHPSEIRLARFLIRQLGPGDVFVDVGAHYGYFSLLASVLVGETGKVFSFEASESTFAMLELNSKNVSNLYIHQKAVTNFNGEISFYEFPNLYSEYNAMDISQYEDEKWRGGVKPKKINVPTVSLTSFLEDQKVIPHLIKIDVEGAENAVIEGLLPFLNRESPVVVMEYLSDDRGNTGHREAEKMLQNRGYLPHIIDEKGNPKPTIDVNKYLNTHQMESENVVFIRSLPEAPSR